MYNNKYTGVCFTCIFHPIGHCFTHSFCISQLEISLLKLAAVSDRAAMALNPNYEAIGKAFVTQYYQVTSKTKE